MFGTAWRCGSMLETSHAGISVPSGTSCCPRLEPRLARCPVRFISQPLTCIPGRWPFVIFIFTFRHYCEREIETVWWTFSCHIWIDTNLFSSSLSVAIFDFSNIQLYSWTSELCKNNSLDSSNSEIQDVILCRGVTTVWQSVRSPRSGQSSDRQLSIRYAVFHVGSLCLHNSVILWPEGLHLNRVFLCLIGISQLDFCV